MVNFHLGTGSSRRWTWREAWWAFSLWLPKITGIYKFQLAGKWSESENVMLCYSLRTCMSRKWVWFWPFNSSKIAAGTCFTSYFADELYRLCMAYQVLIAMKCVYIVIFYCQKPVFFPFQRLDKLWTAFADGSSMEKPLKFKLSAKNT